ncbi:MAG: AtpZ/AtpI family protein [Rhodothermales bacterium]
MNQHRGTPLRQSLRDSGPYLGLGLQLAFTLIAFTLGGYLLDRHFGTLPWLMIAGSLVGIALLFLQLYKTTIDIANRSRRRNERSK